MENLTTFYHAFFIYLIFIFIFPLYNKEAMLRSLMFTLVVLLGAAVALTIILLMVLK